MSAIVPTSTQCCKGADRTKQAPKRSGAFAPWDEWQRYFNDAARRANFRVQTNGLPDVDGTPAWAAQAPGSLRAPNYAQNRPWT